MPHLTTTVVDFDSLFDWIFRTLGAPVLEVELSEDQVGDSIQDAMGWFSDRTGFQLYNSFNIIDGVSEYNLADIFGLSKEPPAIQDVLDVIFESPDTILRDDFGFFYGVPFFGGLLAAGAGPRIRGQIFSYSSLLQWLQYIEQAKRILSAERSWEYDKFSGILRIMPIPSLTVRAMVILKLKINEPEFKKLPERFRRLIKWYALAGAKERLAAIRGKYDSIPAAGRDFSLNGEAMRTEAMELKEKMDEELRGATNFEGSPIVLG